MELVEVLSKLYSQNDLDILNVINTASHVSIENFSGIGRCIHTGFCCRTHKEKSLGFIYCIDNKELYFQGNTPYLLGAYMCPNKYAVFFHDWLVIQKPDNNENSFPYYHCLEYNPIENNLCIDLVLRVDKQNDKSYSIRGHHHTWSHFSIIDNINRYNFNIYKPDIKTFYCGGEHKFRLL